MYGQIRASAGLNQFLGECAVPRHYNFTSIGLDNEAVCRISGRVVDRYRSDLASFPVKYNALTFKLINGCFQSLGGAIMPHSMGHIVAEEIPHADEHLPGSMRTPKFHRFGSS